MKKIIVSDMIDKDNITKVGVIVKRLTLLLMAMFLVACGGTGTNNDQGTSVLAFSYFRVEPSTGLVTTEAISFGTSSLNSQQSFAVGIGIQNRLVGASNVVSAPGGTAVAGGTTAGDTTAGATAGAGDGTTTDSLNPGQFLNITQINCSYDVPGSSIGRVSDSTTVGSVIGAGGSSTIGFPILSPGIKSFFALRANQLPSLPFNLIASCQAVAISQAGDVFESNFLPLQILVTDSTITTTTTDTVDDTVADTVAGATIEAATITEATSEVASDASTVATSAL